MTGIEGAAVSVAGKGITQASRSASEAVAAAREIRRAEQLALVEAAQHTPGFKQAAEIRGRKVAIKEQWGLAIMRPLAGVLGIAKDYFEADFSSDFGRKIEDVPEEHLQTPKASIAGPAMEGIGYSLDEPELKDLYL